MRRAASAGACAWTMTGSWRSACPATRRPNRGCASGCSPNRTSRRCDRALLMPTARAPRGFAPRGRVVCTCFDVAESLLRTSLAAAGGSAEAALRVVQGFAQVRHELRFVPAGVEAPRGRDAGGGGGALRATRARGDGEQGRTPELSPARRPRSCRPSIARATSPAAPHARITDDHVGLEPEQRDRRGDADRERRAHRVRRERRSSSPAARTRATRRTPRD